MSRELTLPPTEIGNEGLALGGLYTPAMLAELLGVPLAVVRRWRRRGLIVPVREVRRLAYFDFREVATARRLAELLAAGVSPRAIERKLAELARFVPGVERPLAELPVVVEGKHLLLRQGDGLVAPGGQIWFDFDEAAVGRSDAPSHEVAVDSNAPAATGRLRLPVPHAAEGESPTADELAAAATELEDDGQLPAAAEMYRAALAAGGPNPQICFALAEVLYRLGDATAARERYYMAIELDEEYVEARANLGCVLAELGERELAAAAFAGALAFHDQYADAHFHLARTLDDLDRQAEADQHWRRFLDLAPESPWAETARRRLAETRVLASTLAPARLTRSQRRRRVAGFTVAVGSGLNEEIARRLGSAGPQSVQQPAAQEFRRAPACALTLIGQNGCACVRTAASTSVSAALYLQRSKRFVADPGVFSC